MKFLSKAQEATTNPDTADAKTLQTLKNSSQNFVLHHEKWRLGYTEYVVENTEYVVENTEYVVENTEFSIYIGSNNSIDVFSIFTSLALLHGA